MRYFYLYYDGMMHIMDSYSYTDHQLVIELYDVTECQFLTRPNVLIVLLEYIDLQQSEWQHETNILEGLPCPLPFYNAEFYLSIAIVIN